MKKFILILPILVPMLTVAQVPVIEYESDGYHAKPWEPIAQNQMSNQEKSIEQQLEEKKERLTKLERDLEIVTALVTNHEGIWNAKQVDAALWAFCFAKMDDDIVYQLMLMGQRHDTIKRELENLITNIKRQVEEGEEIASITDKF